jgi:hypothetical protein
MADWTYVPGETLFNQDFDLFVRKEPFVVTSFTAIKMYIQSTDGVTDFPIGGTAMSITPSDDNNRVRLAVTAAFMPQVEQIYFSQIELVDVATQNRKTFVLDLNVPKAINS